MAHAIRLTEGLSSRHDLIRNIRLSGQPLLLEINMRPSGGIGYTALSGVNLPGLCALYQPGLFSADEVRKDDRSAFCPAVVRSLTEAVSYPSSLNNAIH